MKIEKINLQGRVFWLQIYSLRDKRKSVYQTFADGNLQNTLHSIHACLNKIISVVVTIPNTTTTKDLNKLVEYSERMLQNKVTFLPIEYKNTTAETREHFSSDIDSVLDSYNFINYDIIVSDYVVDFSCFMHRAKQINHWCYVLRTEQEHKLARKYTTYVFDNKDYVYFNNLGIEVVRQGKFFSDVLFMQLLYDIEGSKLLRLMEQGKKRRPKNEVVIFWPYRLDTNDYPHEKLSDYTYYTILVTNPTNNSKALSALKKRFSNVVDMSEFFGFKINNIRDSYGVMLYLMLTGCFSNLKVLHLESDFHTATAEQFCLCPDRIILNKELKEKVKTYLR